MCSSVGSVFAAYHLWTTTGEKEGREGLREGGIRGRNQRERERERGGGNGERRGEGEVKEVREGGRERRYHDSSLEQTLKESQFGSHLERTLCPRSRPVIS